MSDKPLKWNSDAGIAELILTALRRRGPLKPKDIARELIEDNGGHKLHLNTINAVLRGYLANDVVRADRGRWALRPTERR